MGSWEPSSPSPKRAQPPIFSPCLSWPNGWMDQDETWHAGRPRPWPHCVRWGPSSLSPKRGQSPPQFYSHVCCGQMAGWIKMTLGMEVGLGPGDTVLDVLDASSPSPKRAQPPIFGPYLLCPNGWMDQDATWQGGRPQPKRHCVGWGLSSPFPKRGRSLPNFRPMSIAARRLHGSRCHLAWR